MKAARELYDMYAGYMMAVCVRYIADRDAAQDVLQDSFVDIFTSMSRFNYRGEGSLKGWMTQIVVNKSITYLKRNSRVGVVQYMEDVPDVPDDTDIDTEDIPMKVIYDILERMPVGYKTVFNLYVFEHHSHKEIASILCIKEDSSASQLHRAKAILCKEVNRYRTLKNQRI